MGAFLGLLVGGAIAGALGSMFHHYVIRVVKARIWLSQGAILIDVDRAGEFARHPPPAPAAMNLPLEDLVDRVNELGAQNKPIVVFAHRWRRGAIATAKLRAIGWRVLNAGGLRQF